NGAGAPGQDGNGVSNGPSIPPTLPSGFANLPLAFEPNLGQTDSQVQYFTHGAGYQVFLTANSAVFDMVEPSNDPAATTITEDVFNLQFAGGNTNPAIVSSQDLLSRSNYFLGNDPNSWLPDVPQYG